MSRVKDFSRVVARCFCRAVLIPSTEASPVPALSHSLKSLLADLDGDKSLKHIFLSHRTPQQWR